MKKFTPEEWAALEAYLEQELEKPRATLQELLSKKDCRTRMVLEADKKITEESK